MANIQPTGASGIANLGAASTTSMQDLSNEGIAWGDSVSETEYADSSFNFDTYASGLAASMASAGFSASQVTAYINSMYAGYLLDGGLATQQATGSTGTGVSTAGAVGNPNQWGSLTLPGQSGTGALELPGSTSVLLTGATGYNLGTQLGSQSSAVNYAQYRTNLMADLQRAGYTQSQVNNFMSGFDSGYLTAQGSRQAYIPATQLGINAAAVASSGTNIDAYVSTTVIPWLGTVGVTSPAQVNAYVDAFRASFLAAGSSSNSLLNGQAYEAGANLVAANTPNFNLETYINNTLPSTVANWGQLSSTQKQIYIDALTAGYLSAGGTGSVGSRQISAPPTVTGSTSTGGATTPTGAGGPIVQASTTTAFSKVLAGSTPAAFTALLQQYVSNSNTTLANDASKLQGDLGALYAAQAAAVYAESGYALASANGSAPDNSGKLENAAWWGQLVGANQINQQVAWQNVRADESQFLHDLAATSSDPNASTASALYQNYIKDPWYTLEGDMPSDYNGQSLNSATDSTGTHVPSTPTVIPTPAPVSSASLNELLTAASASALPATVSNELTTPGAASSISQGDFTQIVEGYEKLFAANPATYWDSLAKISDRNLAGAINIAVNDLSLIHPREMQVNGGSASSESGIIGTYWSTMNKSANTYAAWAPAQGDSPFTSSLDSAVGGYLTATGHYSTDRANQANEIEQVFAVTGDPPANVRVLIEGQRDSTTYQNRSWDDAFGKANVFMESLYRTDRPEYYAMLSQIKSPKVRDLMNRNVVLGFVQSGAGTYGRAGASAGSSAADVSATLNAGSMTNGK